MKSITIHNLNEKLSKKIEETARREGNSMNRTIKKLLEKSLGITPSPEEDKCKMFEEFFGIWSENESKQFDQAVEDFEIVHPEDWQ